VALPPVRRINPGAAPPQQSAPRQATRDLVPLRIENLPAGPDAKSAAAGLRAARLNANDGGSDAS
jgi:hypothetical protein